MQRRRSKVQVATDKDLRMAVRNALNRAGLTMEQLEEEARTSRFSSEDARRAWFVVSSVRQRIDAA